MSAVKGLLKDDGYKWDEGQVLFSSLMQACKLQNDQVCCRLPIQKPLFETLLFEIGRVFSKQVYLLVLYRAVFCLAYYGLMRIGELAEGTHPVKACDIHIASNKHKILIVLYTSKTHSEAMYQQQIKISALDTTYSEQTPSGTNSKQSHKKTAGQAFFCPFKAVRDYLSIRKNGFRNRQENFFLFQDESPIRPIHVRTVLRTCLHRIHLDPSIYNTMSFCSGRACDLLKMGYSVDNIKKMGRWKSNAVFKYIRYQL